MSKLAYLFSTSFLLNRSFLWILFWVNALGTVYGFEWYRNQLVMTYEEISKWFVIFVPDSPTASLFFTLSLLILLSRQKKQAKLANTERMSMHPYGLIEAFAVITSIKYGIWAVLMIIAGAWQGDHVTWQQYMLICSHLGMAAEAAIFARYFRYHYVHVLVIACWTLFNDAMDYSQEIFPWLPGPLYDDVRAVQWTTVLLSCLCIAAAVMLAKKRDKILV
ncbi:DUF1405 domain-containing protein [Marinicrinis lubricantis]|uniref:DUF1405 domain-containing protein n=1 Tax=Marinicrinis lubricantis TaxID=2086470 RepID=A0ABW1IM50_9BACL